MVGAGGRRLYCKQIILNLPEVYYDILPADYFTAAYVPPYFIQIN